jgi:hypothetical protein
MPLIDPVRPERVPTCRRDCPPASGNRFCPAPLSPTAMVVLQRALARNQRRRRVYRARHLRMCLDGEERWQCDPGGGVCGPFRVPLSASYLEIFGDDADGALLLAAFPLPEPEGVEDDGAQHLSATLEGGQTVALEITLGAGPNGEALEYIIHLAYAESPAVEMRAAEPPVVEAIPAGPRPETSTPGDAWISTARRPEDHREADRVEPRRDVVLVANDQVKRAMAQLVEEFSPVIRQHYRDIAGTMGTANAVRPWLPMVQLLGPGPASEDHSPLGRAWHMLLAVAAYCRERVQWQREVHLFVFFDAEIETHQPFREMLTASLVLPGAYWFPTPATARAYLHALGVVPTEISPQLGTFHDHERAFAMAMQHMTAREHAAGLEILDALYNHIIRTGEQQSRIWLLPTVQAIIEQWQRSNEGATRSKERHITMNH